jgi:hypothetical protein
MNILLDVIKHQYGTIPNPLINDLEPRRITEDVFYTSKRVQDFGSAKWGGAVKRVLLCDALSGQAFLHMHGREQWVERIYGIL